MSDIMRSTFPVNFTPEKLKSVLEDAGWQIVGGRRGTYVRLSPPGEDDSKSTGPSLIIPLDREAPDYSDAMQGVLLRLSQDKETWSRSIYPRLLVEATDEFRFRKESEAPSGLIRWRSGERLIESARRTLLAGAKSYLGPGRHFVNKHGRFASRYLDTILMGQTAPGSYIVTAYAPTTLIVPLKSEVEPTAALVEGEAAQAREVNEAIARSVEATVEALEHYRTSGSLSGFEAGVSRGVSYEMTNAILGIASSSSEADITIEWDSSVDPPVGLANTFSFYPPDVEPLARAAVKLAEDKSSRVVSVMGRVHLLAKKQAGSPGVFGIDSLQSEGPRKVRVRLADEEDYHEAIRAHEEDLALLVSGRLEKEGTLSWLYDATVIRVLNHVDEYLGQKRRTENIPGQLGLFGENG